MSLPACSLTFNNTTKQLFLHQPSPCRPPGNLRWSTCFLFIFLLTYPSPFSNLRLSIPTFLVLPPQSAIRLNENASKISQLKDDQEECETRLEKERDIYASNMFDLLAEEDNISSYIINYVKCESPLYQLPSAFNLQSDACSLFSFRRSTTFLQVSAEGNRNAHD